MREDGKRIFDDDYRKTYITGLIFTAAICRVNGTSNPGHKTNQPHRIFAVICWTSGLSDYCFLEPVGS